MLSGGNATHRLYAVSCYAPTRAAGREVKNAFFQELENILSSISVKKKYVLLWDFNACVGLESSHDTNGME